MEADKTGRTNEIEFEQNISGYPIKVMSRYNCCHYYKLYQHGQL